MVFTRRWIGLSIEGKNIFDPGNMDQMGLRISARISQAGNTMSAQDCTADVLVYGLSISDMNNLTQYGWPNGVELKPFQYLTIDAGDKFNGFSTVFYGTIVKAWPDFQGAPIVPFHILAQSGGVGNVAPTDPLSYDGPVDNIEVYKRLSNKLMESGEIKRFQDLGITGKSDSPYLFHGGSARGMMSQFARMTRTGFINDRGTLLAWPRTGYNKTSSIPTISPHPIGGQWQQISYPGFTQQGVLVKHEFYRALDYAQPFVIDDSKITNANNMWKIIRIDYDLESNTPKGHWWVTLEGAKLDAPIAP